MYLLGIWITNKVIDGTFKLIHDEKVLVFQYDPE